MKDIIKKQAGLCLELRDAFSGKVIGPGRTQVKINGKAPVEQKDMRFFIFQNVEEAGIWIVVQSAGFKMLSCTISWEEYQEKKAIFRSEASGYLQMPNGFWYQEAGIMLLSLWLYPERDYVLPRGYVCEYAEREPNEEIRIIKNPNAPVFLMEDYAGGNSLCMRAKEEAFGRIWRIGEPGGEYEDFTVTGMLGENRVRIEPKLCRTYIRGSRIYELYCTKTDEAGNVMLIFADTLIE